jgi:hypothetical protein
MTTTPDASTDAAAVLEAGAPIEEREAQLVEGADSLRQSKGAWIDNPRLLLGASAALMTFGVSAVLLGWFGAAHSTLVEEQVPYLISGGLLGVALSTIGAFLFFAHWLTVGIREARSREAARRMDHAELMAALQALSNALTPEGGSGGAAGSTRAARPIRRAPRG